MTNNQKKEFFGELKSRGFLEYGSNIPLNIVHTLLEITIPETGTRQQFEKIRFIEFTAISYVRDQLLNDGKYFKETDSGYRVLLPSENDAQVKKYINEGNAKHLRARKLSKFTPDEYKDAKSDQTEARLMMRQRGISQLAA